MTNFIATKGFPNAAVQVWLEFQKSKTHISPDSDAYAVQDWLNSNDQGKITDIKKDPCGVPIFYSLNGHGIALPDWDEDGITMLMLTDIPEAGVGPAGARNSYAGHKTLRGRAIA